MKKNFPRLFLIVSALFLFSCGGSENEDKLGSDTKKEQDTARLVAVNISEETINNIIQSIPTPLEISSLIKDAGANYDVNMLNPASNASNYNSNYDVAFNIGIYSADLGYINIYEKTYSGLEYLSSIKKLADNIKVGQFFDFETLKRIASNNKNYDSLLFISTDNFNKMDKYLRDQKRGELSVLMITGAWLEGMHVATEVCKVKETKELTERIGYEKINLDNIIVILNAYKHSKYFETLAAKMESLKKIYEQVNIMKEYKEPETKEVNGQLVIVDNSKSFVNITEATVQEITAKVAAIRSEMINK
ncbi:MAG: hypothetical protein IAF38_06720 [Bacteroidia bacterium]|nr:hypothetical protein [Bacteroidia bacterium]